MIDLGTMDIRLLEIEFGKLQTDEIIITEERLRHVKERHPEDLHLFEKYGKECISNPDYIIKDLKNTGTVFIVKKLSDTNINMVVRVALETDEQGYKNSIMTFYRLREKNLRKIIFKNKQLYKKE
ncbi:MAG: hypothetical protein LIO99_05230 [Clostridiales bacterium]|nr:hypothetical protein [Clostridiales bacterium]MCC8105406.1 hypothetical protein [Clostridiales bacterium]